MKNPIALITGGGSGLGLELAKLFAADGYSLILVSRNEAHLKQAQAELEAAYHATVEIISLDLTDLEALPGIFMKLKERGLKINVLVNNAGFGLLGAFTELDIKKQLNTIALNISALTYLTRLFLDQAPENAKILNMSSLAAFQPGPYMNVYYATKAYVLSFSEALAEELEDKNISVTALCPGPVATDFWKVSDPNRTRVPRTTMISRLSPEFVARAGYRGLQQGRRVVVPGIMNKLLIFANRFLPRSIVTSIVKGLNTKL